MGHYRRGTGSDEEITDKYCPADRLEKCNVGLRMTRRRDDLEFRFSANDPFGHGLGSDQPRRSPEKTAIRQEMIKSLGIKVFRPRDKDRTLVPLAQFHRVTGMVFMMVRTADRRDRNIFQSLKHQGPGVGKAGIDQQIPNPIKADLKTQHTRPPTVKPVRRDPITKVLDLD